MTDFDLVSYLARVRLENVPCTADGLRAVQSAQLQAIPFESLEPYLGQTPDLTLESLFRKCVHGRRGGYCFELNALLGGALGALGFSVVRSLARVRRTAPHGGARTHLLLQVTIEGERWLADAGFGGSTSLVPLRIDTNEHQISPNGLYRVTADDLTGEKVLERQDDRGWTALYAFDDAWVGDPDIAAANYLCATWPDAPFPNHLMLAGFDGDTRIGVFDRAVTLGTSSGDERLELESLDDLRALAVDRLGLAVDDEILDRVWSRLTGS